MTKNNGKTLCELSGEKFEKKGILILFFLSFLLVMIHLLQEGTMIRFGGDAADIWKTIKTYKGENIHPSYVLYKGFSSVYPYIWLYRLAMLLHINEFFFIMCYHAVLFSYLTVIGIPVLVEALTEYRPRLWQRAGLIIVLFWFWNRYGVLTQLMVDLPSCAYFILSVHCAVYSWRCTGREKYIFVAVTGLLCGLCANISGQYSISAICILIYTLVGLWKTAFPKSKKSFAYCTVILILAMNVAKLLNIWFEASVLTPIRESGVYIASGQAWMERALFYMLDIGRKFYGPDLIDPRGNAIVMDIYGIEEGTHLLQQAAMGVYGWSIPQYFKAFFRYPIDFIMLYLNRFIIMISDDSRNCSMRSLLASYTMIYLAAVTCITRLKKLSDIFSAKFWLVLGGLASIIPTLVMCVEIRVTISFQSLFYGVALAGPMLPQIWKTCAATLHQCRREKSLRCLADKGFPWMLVGWIVFCLICLAYFGSICAASGIGTDMLFKW